MGQQDILEYMKNNPDKWFTPKDIMKKFNLDYPKACHWLRRLSRLGNLEREWHFGNRVAYKFKR